MKFGKFYKYNNLNLENINKSLFEECRDYFQSKENKKGVNKIFIMTDLQLEEEGFFIKYPHLK